MVEQIKTQNGTLYRIEGKPDETPDTTHSGIRVRGGVVGIQLDESGNIFQGNGESAPEGPQIKIGQGVSRVYINNDGVMQSSFNQGVVKANSNDLVNANPGSILSTAKVGGMPTLDVTDDTVVDIPGLGETSAENAARMGYLRKVGGVYYDVSAPAPAQPSQSTSLDTPENQQMESLNDKPEGNSETSDKSSVLLNDEIESTIESYYQTGGEVAANDMLNTALNNGGEIPADKLVQLAPQFGKTPETLQAEVKAVVNEFYKQAYYEVQRLDDEVNPLEVLNFANATYDPDKLRQIQRDQYLGDLSGYKELVNHYNTHKLSEQRMSRLFMSGWQFYQRDGESICYHPEHGELEVPSALKAGLLK